ncbi:hypothetical protein [Flavobacterium sp.]|uniref:hypothetical protein n=1 Tax=Flavobacterium sp. TaxID=239 RepID=UPI0012198C91|nr:hypothetical protein [Flavobacterium sp.]RZJ72868.1 MAG: hypothetical protein EOO49_04335 [Flavobacterium sp.]
MKRYANKSRHSGVIAYEKGPDFIRLLFRDNSDVYTYSNRSAGKTNVERMKRLASEGEGLTTFVTRNVKDKFER